MSDGGVHWQVRTIAEAEIVALFSSSKHPGELSKVSVFLFIYLFYSTHISLAYQVWVFQYVLLKNNVTFSFITQLFLSLFLPI